MEIKKHLTELICELTGDNDYTAVTNAVWINPRKKEVGGLRLSEFGLTILIEKLNLKHHKIDFPKSFWLSNQDIIILDQNINCPYYLDKKSIIVFNDEIAVMMILYGGDMKLFTNSMLQKR